MMLLTVDETRSGVHAVRYTLGAVAEGDGTVGTLPELRRLYERAAVRIAAAPQDRHTLLNAATVLMYVLHRLNQAAVPEIVGHDLEHQPTTPVAALETMYEALYRVRDGRESASTTELHADLECALQSADMVLEFLERS